MGSTARVYHYMRLCPEGRRFLWGGRIKGGRLPETPAGFVHLYRDMLRVFPELSGTRITHCWSGYVGYTDDVFPHLGKYDSIYYATGYCGSGVVRAGKAARPSTICLFAASRHPSSRAARFPCSLSGTGSGTGWSARPDARVSAGYTGAIMNKGGAFS